MMNFISFSRFLLKKKYLLMLIFKSLHKNQQIEQSLLKLFHMENPNFIVELFIRTLEIKHKLTFQKDKEQYFRVLFDTYLNGQGNPAELKDYIAAGIDNPDTINIIADEVVEWQAKAEQLKAAEAAQKNDKQLQKQKIEEFVASRTKKLREEAEQDKKQRKERKDRGDDVKKKHKPHKEKTQVPAEQQQQVKGEVGENPPENNEQQQQQQQQYQQAAQRAQGQSKSLKYELQNQGKQKCKFYPFCKNLENCPYFHPTQRCTYFPHCRYGDGCLYEHEACKFKEKCNKPNCGYAHPFKKANPFQQMMKTLMSQNNPLMMAKSFKKKPNPKYNKPQEGEKEEQK